MELEYDVVRRTVSTDQLRTKLSIGNEKISEWNLNLLKTSETMWRTCCSTEALPVSREAIRVVLMSRPS